MVLDGKISEAVNEVCNRDRGGLYQPNDKCSKTQHPVIDILREKHPEARVTWFVDPATMTIKIEPELKLNSSEPKALAIPS